MVHAVSAFYERSGHMSPVAAALAAGLHVATALALFLASPLNRPDMDDENGKAIEVTIEQPKPPEEPPPPPQEAAKPQPPPQPTPAPQPPAAQPAPPPPTPPVATATPKTEPKPPTPQVSKKPLGVSPPPPEAKTEEAKLEPKPEPQPEPKPEPKQEAAVAQPAEPTPPPPEQPLEKVLPPVEQPAAPLSMRDFVKVPPPPAPPPSPPAPHPTPPAQHTAPQPPAQTLQHSPLSNPQPQSQASASAGPSGSTFVNPAQRNQELRAKDAYLWQVIRKFSQYLPDLREKNEGGTVLLRFVIARDGRLIESSIAKSSGVPALDRGLLESLRAASPYAPLPPEIPGAQVMFVQPIGAARR